MATSKITLHKASELLELNLVQDDTKMPPDVKDAVRLALEAIAFTQNFKEAFDLFMAARQHTTTPTPDHAGPDYPLRTIE